MVTQKEENRQLWELYMEDYHRSGLDQRNFCLRNGLNYSTFRYWKRKFEKEREAENGPQWILVEATGDEDVVRVDLDVDSKRTSEHVRIDTAMPPALKPSCQNVSIHAGVFTVEAPSNIDPLHLAQVLAAVKSVC